MMHACWSSPMWDCWGSKCLRRVSHTAHIAREPNSMMNRPSGHPKTLCMVPTSLCTSHMHRRRAMFFLPIQHTDSPILSGFELLVRVWCVFGCSAMRHGCVLGHGTPCAHMRASVCSQRGWENSFELHPFASDSRAASRMRTTSTQPVHAEQNDHVP